MKINKVIRSKPINFVGKIFAGLLLVIFSFLSSIQKAEAVLTMNDFDVKNNVGNISSIATFFIFVANTLKYFGWAGVVFGIVLVIALLIYKLVFADDQEAMKKVQAGITKAIVLIIIGLVLLGAGLIVTIIGSLFGVSGQLWIIPTQLNQP